MRIPLAKEKDHQAAAFRGGVLILFRPHRASVNPKPEYPARER